MNYLLYGIAGFAGGILGGMGMGGGTILIPLLTIFLNVAQLNAQAINLISFIPMAVVALIIHLRNKLVDFKNSLFVIIPGIAFCILSSYLAKNMDSEILKRCFGGFLLALSIFQIIEIFFIKKSKNQ